MPEAGERFCAEPVVRAPADRVPVVRVPAVRVPEALRVEDAERVPLERVPVARVPETRLVEDVVLVPADRDFALLSAAAAFLPVPVEADEEVFFCAIGITS